MLSPTALSEEIKLLKKVSKSERAALCIAPETRGLTTQPLGRLASNGVRGDEHETGIDLT